MLPAHSIPNTTDIEVAAVIVYGPPGCGKTRNSKLIAQLFSKEQIIDDWKLGDHLPSDALCLSNDERVHGLQQIHLPFHAHASTVFEYKDVARTLKLDNATGAA